MYQCNVRMDECLSLVIYKNHKNVTKIWKYLHLAKPNNEDFWYYNVTSSVLNVVAFKLSGNIYNY